MAAVLYGGGGEGGGEWRRAGLQGGGGGGGGGRRLECVGGVRRVGGVDAQHVRDAARGEQPGAPPRGLRTVRRRGGRREAGGGRRAALHAPALGEPPGPLSPSDSRRHPRRAIHVHTHCPRPCPPLARPCALPPLRRVRVGCERRRGQAEAGAGRGRRGAGQRAARGAHLTSGSLWRRSLASPRASAHDWSPSCSSVCSKLVSSSERG